MQRKLISESLYTVIHDELVISQVCANVMVMTAGRHGIYGRVVLLRSGTSFVIIADDLGSLPGPDGEGGLSRVFARSALPSDSAAL